MSTGLEVAGSEESLVAAAVQGDRGALDAIWRQHRRWIAAVLLAHKPRTEDLDDLLQEVAMTLITKINTLREHSNLRAWLRMVALNAARASGRSGKSRPSGEFDCDAVAAFGGSRGIELDDHAQQILARVTQIPEGYREPLMLKAVHGMRTRHIAEIMNLPEATIDTRISRARRMLREQTTPTSEEAASHAPKFSVGLNGHGKRASHE